LFYLIDFSVQQWHVISGGKAIREFTFHLPVSRQEIESKFLEDQNMWKNKYILLGTVALITMFITKLAYAEDIRLTEEIVQRYIATYPNLWKLTKETEKAAKIKSDEEKTEKLEAIAIERDDLLKSNQWADIFEYNDAGSRILQLNIQLNVKGIYAKLHDERNPKAMELIKKLQDELGFQPEEITAVMKHNSELNKMYIKAGLRKK
jgi:hypothetical protein